MILSKKYSGLLLSASLLIIFTAASYFRVFESYELGSLDLRFLLRSPKIPTSDKIAIIEIGEDTLKKIGRFPFDRSYHAIAVKALSEFGAKAVIFDLLFAEPHEHDNELADAIKNSGRAYLPYAFNLDYRKRSLLPEADGYLANITGDLAQRAKATGHINLIPDIDGKFRRVPLYIKYEDAIHPYISFKAACDYLGIPDKDIKIAPGDHISLGKNISLPLDDRSNMIVNFSGPWGTSYSHYSFVDLLQSYAAPLVGEKPIIDPSNFKDKICIIGLTATGTGDIHPSPFEALYPGVGMHAEVINSILNKKFISRASREMNILIFIILGAIIAFLTMRTKPIAGFLTLIALLFIFILFAILLFDLFGSWIDMICPVIAMGAIYLSCTLYKYIGEWKKRMIMESELGIAKQIQESFLPKSMPISTQMDIAALMLTAKAVGGDLYDFAELKDGRTGIMIGDVSGKGIPASLFMAMVAGSFRSFAKLYPSPKDVLINLNLKLVEESSSNLFVTMFYAIFDFKNKTLTFSNGGHLPLLHMHEDGEIKFLDSKDGTPLGLMDGPYSEDKVEFKKDDVILFYTDGVTEAMNSKREMYGAYRLSAVLRKNSRLSSQEIVREIEKDIRRFEPKSEQHDDITIIAVKIK